MSHAERLFFTVILAVIMCGIIMLMSSCNTFKVYTGDACPECNDFYTAMQLLASQGAKDNALAVTIYQECKAARDAQRKSAREVHCAKLFFPDGHVSKKDADKYINFLECIKN